MTENSANLPPPGGREKRTAGASWQLLALLMAMTAIGPATLNILMPALPALAKDLSSDSGKVQLTVSLYLVSLAAAQLVLGPLSDKFGRRPVVLAGLSINALASLAAVAATTIDALIAIRLVQAVGAATGIVLGRTIVRDLYDRDRAAAMIGLVTTAMVIAPMVSPLIGGLLETAFGWESIFLCIAALSAVVLFWSAAMLPETRPQSFTQSPEKLHQAWRALLAEPKLHAYVLAGALGSAPFFTFLGGSPHIVVTIMGRSSAEYGLWFAVTSLGYMSGNFIASRLSQRYGVDRMVTGGIVIELVGVLLTTALVLLLPDAGPFIIFVPQLVISMGNGILLPNAIAGAVSVRPQAAGSAAGLSGFAQMAGGAAATQIVSLVLAGATTPMPMVWMMLIEVGIAGIGFALLVRR